MISRRISFGTDYYVVPNNPPFFVGNLTKINTRRISYGNHIYVADSNFSFYLNGRNELAHRNLKYGREIYTVSYAPIFFSNSVHIPKVTARVYNGVVLLTYSDFSVFVATPSFNVSLTCSPSPAYVRLTDTSDVPIEYVNNTTRIWNIVNNRSLEQMIFSTLENPVEVVLNGVWGDTFDISLTVEY